MRNALAYFRNALKDTVGFTIMLFINIQYDIGLISAFKSNSLLKGSTTNALAYYGDA